VATPWLDDAHTIFGEVAGGEDQDVVNNIVQGDTITTVKIDGDTAALLAEQAEHVEAWNATLDG
jgi:peptidyl-prolyl cis-trans isomerase B (cyclophilin B)